MNLKTYRRIRILVALFIAMTVSISVTTDNFILALAAVITGMIFMLIIKSKVKDVLVDERVQSVGEKAARVAFNIVTLVLGISSFLITFFGRISAPYLEGLGYILSYLTLFCLFVYSLAFYYFNKKFGADDNE